MFGARFGRALLAVGRIFRRTDQEQRRYAMPFHFSPLSLPTLHSVVAVSFGSRGVKNKNKQWTAAAPGCVFSFALEDRLTQVF